MNWLKSENKKVTILTLMLSIGGRKTLFKILRFLPILFLIRVLTLWLWGLLMIMIVIGMILTAGNVSSQIRTCHSTTFSTVNLRWTGPESISSLHGDSLQIHLSKR